jgi:hypothetical protein
MRGVALMYLRFGCEGVPHESLWRHNFHVQSLVGVWNKSAPSVPLNPSTNIVYSTTGNNGGNLLLQVRCCDT